MHRLDAFADTKKTAVEAEPLKVINKYGIPLHFK